MVYFLYYREFGLSVWNNWKLVITCSSTEVLYRALSNKTYELLWLQWLLVDANWVGDPTTSYCFLLGTSLPSVVRSNIYAIARSNIEVACRALANTTSKLLWLQWPLAHSDAPHTTSTHIDYHNWSAIHIAPRAHQTH